MTQLTQKQMVEIIASTFAKEMKSQTEISEARHKIVEQFEKGEKARTKMINSLTTMYKDWPLSPVGGPLPLGSFSLAKNRDEAIKKFTEGNTFKAVNAFASWAASQYDEELYPKTKTPKAKVEPLTIEDLEPLTMKAILARANNRGLNNIPNLKKKDQLIDAVLTAQEEQQPASSPKADAKKMFLEKIRNIRNTFEKKRTFDPLAKARILVHLTNALEEIEKAM